MKKRDERSGGPEASSPLRHLVPEGGLSSPRLDEARSMQLHRVDQAQPQLRHSYPEAFFYGPAKSGNGRWSSSLVAAMLSLTLAASMIGVALVGGNIGPSSIPTGPGQLQSEVDAPLVEVPASAPVDGAVPVESELAAAPVETAPLGGPEAAPAAPAAPLEPAPVVDGGVGEEAFEQGGENPGSGSGGGDQGGEDQGGDGGEEGGLVGGGDGAGIDSGVPPAPPSADYDDGKDDDYGEEDDGDSDEGELPWVIPSLPPAVEPSEDDELDGEDGSGDHDEPDEGELPEATPPQPPPDDVCQDADVEAEDPEGK